MIVTVVKDRLLKANHNTTMDIKAGLMLSKIVC